jgi:hypothetical protein
MFQPERLNFEKQENIASSVITVIAEGTAMKESIHLQRFNFPPYVKTRPPSCLCLARTYRLLSDYQRKSFKVGSMLHDSKGIGLRIMINIDVTSSHCMASSLRRDNEETETNQKGRPKMLQPGAVLKLRKRS